MPRRSSSPSAPQRKITTMPLVIDYKKNLPAVIPEKPSFLQTMKEGVALGVGSSIGHRVVGALLGPATVQNPIVDKKNEEYEQCMKDNSDKTGCEHLLRTKY